MTFRDNMRAAKAIGSKNYDAAIEIYKKKFEADPTDSFALSMIAHCYKWKGDTEAALEYANKMLSQYPQDFYILLLAAMCWFEKGNEEQTYNYVCRTLENAPQTESENIPKVLYFLLKVCSIFKKYRKLESMAREDETECKKYYKESIEWAWKYKQWYETKHSNI